MTERKKILLCISNQMYYLGLFSLLEKSGYEVLHEDNCRHVKADYTIISLDGRTLDGVAQIAEKFETGAVVLLVEAIKSFEFSKIKPLIGVKALLNFDTSPEILIAVLSLLPAHEVINRSIIIPDASIGSGVTLREWEIGFLLAKGNSVKEIARALGLSVKTVETHKMNLMRKLDVHDRLQLADWCRSQPESNQEHYE